MTTAQDAPQHSTLTGKIKAFEYLTAEKATLYRTIMRAFSHAKARFTLHLRPREITALLRDIDPNLVGDTTEVERALNSLCEWGNLERHLDTTEVTTVEEFLRPRYLYQITQVGEAAEQAVQTFEEAVQQTGELQSAALTDIIVQLDDILELCRLDEPIDDAQAHRTLSPLWDRFEGLTLRAQSFIRGIQRTSQLQGVDVEQLVDYKQKLIDYLERFIGHLVITTAEIVSRINQIEEHDIATLLNQAAERDLIDRIEVNDAMIEQRRSEWSNRWTGLKRWFVGHAGRRSQAEELRAHARSAIPALLRAVMGIHDRRVMRSDRTADLKTLARWFAETDTAEDAHRLWRAAFGLSPARHLRIDEDTLDQWDTEQVTASTPWPDAPPLVISPRMRQTGRHSKPGRPTTVVDHSYGKSLLKMAAEKQAQQLAAARSNLITDDRIRLSEMSKLDTTEFRLFLDLLGEALARKRNDAQIVDIASNDGLLRITLEPTPDNISATLQTSLGEFRGRDHFVHIRDAFPSASGVRH